jgi:hypothetical protein
MNPPGFCWWRAEGAATYDFRIEDHTGRIVYETKGLTDPVHVPARALPPGEYSWRVTALRDAPGGVLDTWGPRRFSLAAGAPEQPWIPADELLRRAPREHPRLIFLREDLDALRASATDTRREPVAGLLAHADRCLALDPPAEPAYDRLQERNERLMAYVECFRDFRRVVDGGMEPLALAYLFTGERTYGDAAARILTAVAKWNPEGISSILAPYGDEVGLSLVKTGAHCYDWLYDLLTDDERASVRRMLIARASQMLRRLRRMDFLSAPGESHAGRLPGYLCEHAIALAEEPEAVEWLDYALRALCTVFPHWGGQDGGWAEGISYGRAYNTILLPPFEAVRAALGVDLWQRPFFRKVRRFFFYCSSPVGEIAPFGDGGTGVNGRGAASLMYHHAQLFRDAACRWWVEQANPAARRSANLVHLILPDEVRPEPPGDIPQDAVFHDVGWAALHGNLADPSADTLVLLKSSPYGSVSHSHADQNSLAVLHGGKALAMPSGHYGPAYGMPHHVKWTRQTKAHCSILADGDGQEDRSAAAQGRIVRFHTGRRIGYAGGDATDAYAGKLGRFLRHVVLIRPGVIGIVDVLRADPLRRTSRFQWLLHAMEPFDLDEAAQTVISRREGARMTVHLHTPGGFDFSQTDVFETPFNEGNPPEHHRDMPNHHHFEAATREFAALRHIVALVVVEGPGEEYTARAVEPATGWCGLDVEYPDGVARLMAPVEPGAAPPAGMSRDALLQALWTPHEGESERLDVPGS